MHLNDSMQQDTSNYSIVQKPANKNYGTDIDIALKYTRWILKCIGVWPLVTKNPSKISLYFSPVLIIMCNGIMAFILIPTVLHMILREKNPMVKLMLVGPISSCSASCLKYALMVMCRKTIKICIDHMETDWMENDNVQERAIMTKNAKIGSGITITCGSLLTASGVFYHLIMPIVKGNTINEFNETIRPIIYPGYDIFVEPQKTPTFEIIFFGIFLSGFVRYGVTLAECSIAAVFVTHACGQMQIVISRLENLFDGIDETIDGDKLQMRISSAIHCHVRGLRLSSKIDDALRKICLVEAGADTLIICLLEYYCMTEWTNSETVAIITYVILLTCYTFNIFMLCHIGELLKEQYHEVATATYMIEWYRLPGKTGLALVMVIAMANIPRKLTAGQMLDLSVTSFGAIMKTSFVYLNMLRTFAE